MKLIIQIPCYNEEHTLPNVLREIPQEIEGIHHIETLVIDDGSTDRTAQVAQLTGANHVIRNIRNLGLAFSFRRDWMQHLRLELILLSTWMVTTSILLVASQT